MTDDIEINDHIKIKDRGDDRKAPNSGVSLYVDDGKLKGVDADGVREIPIESLSTDEGIIANMSIEKKQRLLNRRDPRDISTWGTAGRDYQPRHSTPAVVSSHPINPSSEVRVSPSEGRVNIWETHRIIPYGLAEGYGPLYVNVTGQGYVDGSSNCFLDIVLEGVSDRDKTQDERHVLRNQNSNFFSTGWVEVRPDRGFGQSGDHMSPIVIKMGAGSDDGVLDPGATVNFFKEE
jgi:hypothetical protein